MLGFMTWFNYCSPLRARGASAMGQALGYMTKFIGWNSKKRKRRHREVACPASQAGNWQRLILRSALAFESLPWTSCSAIILPLCLSLRPDWEFQEGSTPGVPHISGMWHHVWDIIEVPYIFVEGYQLGLGLGRTIFSYFKKWSKEHF